MRGDAAQKIAMYKCGAVHAEPCLLVFLALLDPAQDNEKQGKKHAPAKQIQEVVGHVGRPLGRLS